MLGLQRRWDVAPSSRPFDQATDYVTDAKKNKALKVLQRRIHDCNVVIIIEHGAFTPDFNNVDDSHERGAACHTLACDVELSTEDRPYSSIPTVETVGDDETLISSHEAFEMAEDAWDKVIDFAKKRICPKCKCDKIDVSVDCSGLGKKKYKKEHICSRKAEVHCR